jgi:hypothetical protein
VSGKAPAAGLNNGNRRLAPCRSHKMALSNTAFKRDRVPISTSVRHSVDCSRLRFNRDAVVSDSLGLPRHAATPGSKPADVRIPAGFRQHVIVRLWVRFTVNARFTSWHPSGFTDRILLCQGPYMKTYLITASALVGLFGLASIIPALFSVTMFDAPGSTENPATIALAIAVASCPFVCFGAISIAWSSFRAGRSGLAKLVVWAPIINLIVGGIAWNCLQTFYGGQFNG